MVKLGAVSTCTQGSLVIANFVEDLLLFRPGDTVFCP